MWGTLAEITNGNVDAEIQKHLKISPTKYARIEKRILLTSKKITLRVISRLLKAAGAEQTDKNAKELRKILSKPPSIRFFPDAKLLVPSLSKKYRLALLTNAYAPTRDTIVSKHAGFMKYFHPKIFSCDVGTAKPNTTMISTILKELHASKDEAIIIGDSQTDDIDPAERLGIKAVLINRRRGQTLRDALAGV